MKTTTKPLRFEKVVLDVAKAYYKEEAKRLKKDISGFSVLSKQLQQILLVRYHFKIAYYGEFRKVK